MNQSFSYILRLLQKSTRKTCFPPEFGDLFPVLRNSIIILELLISKF